MKKGLSVNVAEILQKGRFQNPESKIQMGPKLQIPTLGRFHLNFWSACWNLTYSKYSANLPKDLSPYIYCGVLYLLNCRPSQLLRIMAGTIGKTRNDSLIQRSKYSNCSVAAYVILLLFLFWLHICNTSFLANFWNNKMCKLNKYQRFIWNIFGKSYIESLLELLDSQLITSVRKLLLMLLCHNPVG